MSNYTTLKTNADPTNTVRSLLQKMLSRDLVDSVMVAAKTPYSALPMPTLFSDPAKMDGVDPLAPVAPFNAARQATAVLKHQTGKRVAVVLRPCEMRALVELAKLNQCRLDDVVKVGIECMGRMENAVYLEQIKRHPGMVVTFDQDEQLQSLVCPTCRSCEHFQPKGADVVLCIIGHPVSESIGLCAETEMGVTLLEQLGQDCGPEPDQRQQLVDQLLLERREQRNRLFQETSLKIKPIEKLQHLLANCLNCYNCRVACPVCYCKECVFVTDVFAHEPEVLLRRAQKRGMVKLPADTTMFHLTRLAHMSHACVECGHCSSVCPSEIPVADFFRTVSAEVQELYAYEPGRDISEPIPVLIFEEREAKETKN